MIPEDTTGGGMFQVWFEYGLISFALFSIYSFRNCIQQGEILSIFFWIVLVFMYGINNSVVWLAIILLATNKYFFRQAAK